MEFAMKKFILTLLCLIGISQVAYGATCLKDYGGDDSCLDNPNPSGDCTTLGYSKSDVTGCLDYIYCPFDPEYKKCVYGTSGVDCAQYGFNSLDKSKWCSKIVECPNDASLTLCATVCYVDQELCEKRHMGASCSSSDNCYAPTGCKVGYCNTGTGCNIVCSETDYPYSDQIENAEMIDECVGYIGTSQGSCTGDVVLRYADYICYDNYCKMESRCQPLCDEEMYPIAGQIENAIMSDDVCLGYLKDSDGNCSGEGINRYADFECEPGYRKNAAKTACVVDTCPYVDKQECLDRNLHSNCDIDTTVDLDECYVPSTCKTGYVTESECSEDASELINVDANGCGICNCPHGKAVMYNGVCTPAYSSCEAAGLITPTATEKTFCGDGIVNILDLNKNILKCYMEHCSYCFPDDTPIPCTPSGASGTFVDLWCNKYQFNDAGQFEWVGKVRYDTYYSALPCTGTVYPPTSGSMNNGGGGGGSLEYCKGEKDIFNMVNTTFTNKFISGQREMLQNAGIYTMDTNRCADLQEYENHNL